MDFYVWADSLPGFMKYIRLEIWIQIDNLRCWVKAFRFECFNGSIFGNLCSLYCTVALALLGVT